jgi:glutamate formiminotransferase/formiminotetrahydrofolate cyclodeaminase
VGALCARTAVYGAYLNVRINAAGLKDESLKSGFLNEAEDLLQKSLMREKEILDIVQHKL